MELQPSSKPRGSRGCHGAKDESERSHLAARDGQEASGVPRAPRGVARRFAAQGCEEGPSPDDEFCCERTLPFAEAEEVSKGSRDAARAGREACGVPKAPCSDARFPLR